MAKPRPTTPAPGTSQADHSTSNTSTIDPISKTVAPKPRHDVGLAWLVLTGLLILAALPLLIDLKAPGFWSEQEALTVAISVETYQRKAPMAEADTSLQAWTPVYQGESRWDLPPGTTWLHQLMYLGMPTNTNANEQAIAEPWILRARLGSVFMALLFVAAIFWAGYSLGGLPTATISALAAMTMPLILGFARHANPHIAASAWSALSIAGALWAMRPLRTAPSLPRQLIGWITCGIGLGMATLTLGPAAIPGTLLCTITLAMLCPRRISHIMGLLASTTLAALLLMPWAMHVHGHDPAIYQRWIERIAPDLTHNSLGSILGRASWRLTLATTLSGLWLIWLIPAMTQPFSTSTDKQARRKLLLGWGWLAAALLLVLFAPGDTKYAGLLIAVAPASVAIGLIAQQFHQLSAEGRHARLWHVGKWLTCGSTLCLAIAAPLLGYLINHHPQSIQWLPQADQPWIATMHTSFYAGTAAALLLAAILATRFATHNHPGRTIACLAIWLLIFFGLAAIPVSRSEPFNTHYTPPQTDRHEADF